jgi:Domain of unknown function (DUF4384)
MAGQPVVRGLEPLNALAASYHASVGLAAAADEFGVSRATLKARLDRLPEPLRASTRRLVHGVVPRNEINRILALVDSDVPSVPTTTSSLATGSAIEPNALAIWPSADVYRPGDVASFQASTTVDCHLTLIGIDRRGIATVLFPNDFEPDNWLPAGRVLRVPSENAAYQFRLRQRGRETVVGVCVTGAKSFAGIEHDFERQRFTMLGNWRNFVSEALTVPADPPKKAADVPAKGRRAARERDKEKEPERSPGFADPHAHMAISYEVR